ncbi:MAG TPA: alpha/beta hydrolase, partial [Salinimicrobium sp.]|nr:alpha/beta hydrolase [Salinimicrobium sp.]
TKGIAAALQGMKLRKDRIKVLKSFPGTKFILAGEQDPLLNPEDLKYIAKTCGCQFLTFSGGHLSMVENKTELFEFVYFIE